MGSTMMNLIHQISQQISYSSQMKGKVTVDYYLSLNTSPLPRIFKMSQEYNSHASQIVNNFF